MLMAGADMGKTDGNQDCEQLDLKAGIEEDRPDQLHILQHLGQHIACTKLTMFLQRKPVF